MRAVGIATVIALFVGVGLAALDHLRALTLRTSDRDKDYHTPSQEKGLPWHTLNPRTDL
jgi:hypothetical protein